MKIVTKGFDVPYRANLAYLRYVRPLAHSSFPLFDRPTAKVGPWRLWIEWFGQSNGADYTRGFFEGFKTCPF